MQLKILQRDRLSTVAEQTVEKEVLKVWKALPETFGVLKKGAKAFCYLSHPATMRSVIF